MHSVLQPCSLAQRAATPYLQRVKTPHRCPFAMDNNSAFSFGDTYDATLIARCPIAFGRGNCTKRGVGRAERVTMQAYDLAYKLCVIGDAGVGKTCIIQRFADDVFNENTISTIGIDFRYKIIQDAGKVIKMEIWDPAGSERYRSLVQTFFRGLHGVIYAYDITDRASYDSLKSYWIEHLASKQVIRQDVLKLLVGNKSDLAPSKRAVPFEEAQEYAKSIGIPFLETSAKDGKHIEKAFQMMAAAIREGSRPDHSDVLYRNAQPLAAGKAIDLSQPHEPAGSEQSLRKKCCDSA